MTENNAGKMCKQCGASLVMNCPVKEEPFCEKKKAAVCPSCQHVDYDEEEPICNYNVEKK